MVTSSILANIVIDDPKQADAFADLLEELSQEPERRPLGMVHYVLSDPKAIKSFLDKMENDTLRDPEYPRYDRRAWGDLRAKEARAVFVL